MWINYLAGSEEFYEKSVQRIRAKNPDFKVVEHEESARGQLELLKRLTPADSGSFLNWNGKKVRLSLLSDHTMQLMRD